MKVSELKEILAGCPDDWDVILSSDGEGNDFSPLADTGRGYYKPERSWFGDFTTSYDSGRRLRLSRCNAICLWPTN